MPLYLRITRWIAIGVLMVAELILIVGPLLRSPLSWLTSQSADWWGAAGQWVGGIGSCAAVIVALSLARRDGKRAEEERRDREMAQARLVFIETFQSDPTSILVVNRSKEPILGVELLNVTSGDPSFCGWELAPMEGELDHFPVVPASGNGFFRMSMEIGVGVDGVKDVHDLRWEYTIGFVDANGLSWTRTNNGSPERDLSGRIPRLV